MIQYPVKINRAALQAIDFKMMHVWVARFFYIYLTHEWFVFGTRSEGYNPYTFKIMLMVLPRAFLFFTIGLWLSTTQCGFRHKKLVCLLLLPSLLVSPSILGFPLSIMGWIAFLVAFWSYLIIFRETGKTKWNGASNEYFYDFNTSQVLRRDQFVAEIKLGHYPAYGVRTVHFVEFPFSKKDNDPFNNLG